MITFLKLYMKHHRLLCINNMEGARLIWNWLYREAIESGELSQNDIDTYIASPVAKFDTPRYLENYNNLELAKIVSSYRENYNLESLSIAYNAITYYLILEALKCKTS